MLIVLIGIGVIGILQAAGTNLKALYCQLISYFDPEACSQFLDDWELYDGDCEVTPEGQICCSNFGYTFAEDFSGQDYVIQIKNAHLTEGMGYGIFFRTQVAGGTFNGYNFQYDPGYGSGAFLFRKWVNGYELPPLARANAPTDYNWYEHPRDITIQVQGTSFTAFIDGKQVLSASDSTYTESGVGLRTWGGSEVCLDQVIVQTR